MKYTKKRNHKYLNKNKKSLKKRRGLNKKYRGGAKETNETEDYSKAVDLAAAAAVGGAGLTAAAAADPNLLKNLGSDIGSVASGAYNDASNAVNYVSSPIVSGLDTTGNFIKDQAGNVVNFTEGVGGDISTGLNDAGNYIKDQAGNVVNFAEGVGGDIGSGLDATGKFIQDVGSVLPMNVDATGKFIQGVPGYIGSGLDATGKFIQGVPGDVTSGLDATGKFIQGVPGDVTSGLDATGKFLQGVPGDVTSGLDATGKFFQGVPGDVTSGLNAAGNAIGTGLDAAGNAIGTGLDDAGNAIGSGLDAAGNAIGSGLDAAGNTIGTGLDAAGNTIGTGLDAAGNTIGTGLDDAGNYIKEQAGNIYNYSRDGVDNAYNFVRDNVDGTLRDISSGIEGIPSDIQGIPSAIEGIPSDIQAIPGAVASGVSTIGSNLGSNLSTLGSGIERSGEFVGQELKDGVQAIPGAVASGVSTLGSGIERGAEFVGQELKDGVQAVGDGVQAVGAAIPQSLSYATGEIGSGIDYVGDSIRGFAGDITKDATDVGGSVSNIGVDFNAGVGDIGQMIDNTGNAIYSGVTGLEQGISTSLQDTVGAAADVIPNTIDDIGDEFKNAGSQVAGLLSSVKDWWNTSGVFISQQEWVKSASTDPNHNTNTNIFVSYSELHKWYDSGGNMNLDDLTFNYTDPNGNIETIDYANAAKIGYNNFGQSTDPGDFFSTLKDSFTQQFQTQQQQSPGMFDRTYDTQNNDNIKFIWQFFLDMAHDVYEGVKTVAEGTENILNTIGSDFDNLGGAFQLVIDKVGESINYTGDAINTGLENAGHIINTDLLKPAGGVLDSLGDNIEKLGGGVTTGIEGLGTDINALGADVDSVGTYITQEISQPLASSAVVASAFALPVAGALLAGSTIINPIQTASYSKIKKDFDYNTYTGMLIGGPPIPQSHVDKRLTFEEKIKKGVAVTMDNLLGHFAQPYGNYQSKANKSFYESYWKNMNQKEAREKYMEDAITEMNRIPKDAIFLSFDLTSPESMSTNLLIGGTWTGHSFLVPSYVGPHHILLRLKKIFNIEDDTDDIERNKKNVLKFYNILQKIQRITFYNMDTYDDWLDGKITLGQLVREISGLIDYDKENNPDFMGLGDATINIKSTKHTLPYPSWGIKHRHGMDKSYTSVLFIGKNNKSMMVTDEHKKWCWLKNSDGFIYDGEYNPADCKLVMEKKSKEEYPIISSNKMLVGPVKKLVEVRFYEMEWAGFQTSGEDVNLGYDNIVNLKKAQMGYDKNSDNAYIYGGKKRNKISKKKRRVKKK
jgi:hypothetical protein